MKRFAVRNLDLWQHYKNRNPPWIKLHVVLLSNYDFGRLPDASKAHAIAIMLLASQNENSLPWDPKWIGSKINATSPVNLEVLVSAGVIEVKHDASAMLADGKQSACGELEKRRDTKEETEERREDFCSEAASRSEPAMTFAVVGPGGKEYGIEPAFVAKYQAAYPALDVLAEFRKAKLWLETNPTKRKTARGTPAFLARWLSNAVDGARGSTNGNGPHSSKRQPAKNHVQPGSGIDEMFPEAK